MAQLVVGGGCFWCVEGGLKNLRGVSEVIPGYSGGDSKDPTYQQVCSGNTGHAEVVRVTFDEQTISLKTLLEVFFTLHDPTQLNRQGPCPVAEGEAAEDPIARTSQDSVGEGSASEAELYTTPFFQEAA